MTIYPRHRWDSMDRVYLTPQKYLTATTGQETASLVSNVCVLASSASQGATSIDVIPATTVDLAPGDSLYIFDQGMADQVTVAEAAAAGTTAIQVNALIIDHAAGASVCGDGSRGSLAESIIEASATAERLCRQNLLQATNTEVLPLMTSRAAVDNNRILVLRPLQAPVTALASVTWSPGGQQIPLNTSNAVIDTEGWLVRVPVINQLQQAPQQYGYAAAVVPGSVTVTYTAGFAYADLPPVVTRAMVLLISDILSDRLNPTGAAETNVGKTHIVGYLRGDLAGENALYKRARSLLRPYTQGAW